MPQDSTKTHKINTFGDENLMRGKRKERREERGETRNPLPRWTKPLANQWCRGHSFFVSICFSFGFCVSFVLYCVVLAGGSLLPPCAPKPMSDDSNIKYIISIRLMLYRWAKTHIMKIVTYIMSLTTCCMNLFLFFCADDRHHPGPIRSQCSFEPRWRREWSEKKIMFLHSTASLRTRFVWRHCGNPVHTLISLFYSKVDTVRLRQIECIQLSKNVLFVYNTVGPDLYGPPKQVTRLLIRLVLFFS